LELVLPLCIVLGGTAIVMLYQKIWIGFFVVIGVAAFIVHMLLTTYYVIQDDWLTIRCGFLYNHTIQISTIRRIAPSNNPLSSPAASLDRLEISYERFNTVMISPKEKQQFVTQLKQRNPKIEVVLNANKK
jgi:hypothetical protein